MSSRHEVGVQVARPDRTAGVSRNGARQAVDGARKWLPTPSREALSAAVGGGIVGAYLGGPPGALAGMVLTGVVADLTIATAARISRRSR